MQCHRFINQRTTTFGFRASTKPHAIASLLHGNYGRIVLKSHNIEQGHRGKYLHMTYGHHMVAPVPCYIGDESYIANCRSPTGTEQPQFTNWGLLEIQYAHTVFVRANAGWSPIVGDTAYGGAESQC